MWHCTCDFVQRSGKWSVWIRHTDGSAVRIYNAKKAKAEKLAQEVLRMLQAQEKE